MNEIAQMVAEKFNVSPETAQQIVSFILEQVKGRLPEGVSQHLEGWVAGAGTEGVSKGLMDTFKNMASSLVGKE